MYKLTKRREAKDLPILDAAYNSLRTHGGFEVGRFEMDLRKCWNIGYHELYEVLEDAFRDDRWLYVAVYYMERVNPCPTCELKHALAKAYGIDSWHGDAETKAAHAAFWKKSKLPVKL